MGINLLESGPAPLAETIRKAIAIQAESATARNRHKNGGCIKVTIEMATGWGQARPGSITTYFFRLRKDWETVIHPSRRSQIDCSTMAEAMIANCEFGATRRSKCGGSVSMLSGTNPAARCKNLRHGFKNRLGALRADIERAGEEFCTIYICVFSSLGPAADLGFAAVGLKAVKEFFKGRGLFAIKAPG